MPQLIPSEETLKRDVESVQYVSNLMQKVLRTVEETLFPQVTDGPPGLKEFNAAGRFALELLVPQTPAEAAMEFVPFGVLGAGALRLAGKTFRVNNYTHLANRIGSVLKKTLQNPHGAPLEPYDLGSKFLVDLLDSSNPLTHSTEGKKANKLLKELFIDDKPTSGEEIEEVLSPLLDKYTKQQSGVRDVTVRGGVSTPKDPGISEAFSVHLDELKELDDARVAIAKEHAKESVSKMLFSATPRQKAVISEYIKVAQENADNPLWSRFKEPGTTEVARRLETSRRNVREVLKELEASASKPATGLGNTIASLRKSTRLYHNNAVRKAIAETVEDRELRAKLYRYLPKPANPNAPRYRLDNVNQEEVVEALEKILENLEAKHGKR